MPWGIAAGGAIQYRTGKVGVKFGKKLHRIKCRGTQRLQVFALLVFLEQRLIGTQLAFDFVIGGQHFAIADPECLGCLALGRGLFRRLPRLRARRSLGRLGFR